MLGSIVGADAYIGPDTHNHVGAGAYIGPDTHNHVGADAYIGPHMVLSKIGTVVEKYTRSIPGIDHYVIMPNHVHMILKISATNPLDGPMWASAPTNGTVSDRIRSWKTLISKAVGCSIWQRSFYDHIIRNERDYITISEYILNNPAKWREDKYYTL